MREDRRIIFEFEEVYKAIFTLCAAKEMRRPPAGIVQAISDKESDPTTVVMHIKPLDESPVMLLDYSRDFLAAALLSFCRGMGVPIPKKARKSIVMANNSVVMRVEI